MCKEKIKEVLPNINFSDYSENEIELLEQVVSKVDISKYTEAEVNILLENLKNSNKFAYPTNNKDGIIKEVLSEKQHYVPKVLLKQFSENNEGYVYLYDINSKKFVTENKVSVNDIMKKKNLYVFKDKKGKDNFFFEKYLFSLNLEANFDNIVNKLLKHDKLEEIDWQMLSGFIVYQYVRTPSFINSLKLSYENYIKTIQMNKTYDQIGSAVNKMQKETGKSINMSIDELYEYSKSGNYDVIAKNKEIMMKSLSLGNKFWPDFLTGHYEILETRKNSFFICSDAPFFIIPPNNWPRNMGVGLFGPPDAECLIPINKKQCISLQLLPKETDCGISISYRTINARMVNRINKYICKNAEKYIITQDKNYLESIIKQIDFVQLKRDKNRETIVYDKESAIIMYHQFFPY